MPEGVKWLYDYKQAPPGSSGGAKRNNEIEHSFRLNRESKRVVFIF